MIAKHEEFTGKKGQALTVHTFGTLIAAKKLRLVALAGKDGLCRTNSGSLAVQTARLAKDLKSARRVLAFHREPSHPQVPGRGTSARRLPLRGVLDGNAQTRRVPSAIARAGPQAHDCRQAGARRSSRSWAKPSTSPATSSIGRPTS